MAKSASQCKSFTKLFIFFEQTKIFATYYQCIHHAPGGSQSQSHLWLCRHTIACEHMQICLFQGCSDVYSSMAQPYFSKQNCRDCKHSRVGRQKIKTKIWKQISTVFIQENSSFWPYFFWLTAWQHKCIRLLWPRKWITSTMKQLTKRTKHIYYSTAALCVADQPTIQALQSVL